MNMSIWARYFLSRFMKMFFLFLSCFYGLFVIIDYATHTHSFVENPSLEWVHVIKYYIFVFASRSEILIPLAILIASLYTIYTLNTHMELIALRACGFSLLKLMSPFVGMGLICTLLMYVNAEFFLPGALAQLKKIESTTKHQRKSLQNAVAVNSMSLEDGSLFFYQNFDETTHRFFDTYWVESIDSIYRMKYLSPPSVTSTQAVGTFVDHLKRMDNGELQQEKEYQELTLPKMKFGQERLRSSLLDPECLSLSELWTQVKSMEGEEMNDKESQILTSLYSRCTLPWLSLFAAIATAPFCARFSRQQPFFIVILCSLFGLIAFYLFLDAASVISRRQLLSPLIAITGSFILFSSYFFVRFLRINRI